MDASLLEQTISLLNNISQRISTEADKIQLYDQVSDLREKLRSLRDTENFEKSHTIGVGSGSYVHGSDYAIKLVGEIIKERDQLADDAHAYKTKMFGWSFERKSTEKDLFDIHIVRAPNGFSAVVGNIERNPSNVLYMLAKVLTK